MTIYLIITFIFSKTSYSIVVSRRRGVCPTAAHPHPSVPAYYNLCVDAKLRRVIMTAPEIMTMSLLDFQFLIVISILELFLNDICEVKIRVLQVCW